ncbi:NAD(P)H-quinone oxidoreductase [Maritalea sp.]|uniref:NAD(P)H-quinone oxidoreductase n=1 Tax=Maritalea sp. TaxID=2003361 RepID=UPI003EF33923
MTEKTMQAISIEQPGGPEVLKLVEAPMPYAYEGEVLIKVHAAGVNRPDILQRMGAYPPPKDASPLPGLEVAGIVEKVGRGVTNLKEGDQVIALCNGGGYAEYVAVPAGQVLPLPNGWTMTEGAALPETLFTVQQTMIDRAGLESGQTVLIHGGAGGIGAAAIQLAKLKDCFVLATASSEEKLDYVRSVGADIAINYLTEDFVEKTKTATKDKGANVILDIIGSDYVDRNIRAAAIEGTIVQLANLGGREATITMGLVVAKRLTIFGSTLRAQPNEVKENIANNMKSQIWPALESGKFIKPKISTYELQDASAAHRDMDAGDHFGKIVLRTSANTDVRND